jgi:integrase
LDTPLLFPGLHGGYLNLHNWRAKHWKPALRASGLAYRTPYALRHTFASFGIAAGVPLFELARFMGTSAALDAFGAISEANGHDLGTRR